MNKKEEIINRNKKKKILGVVNSLPGIVNYHFFNDNEEIEYYEKNIERIIKYDYPIFFNLNDMSVEEFVDNLIIKLTFRNNSPVVLLPYFKGENFWIKLEIKSYKDFLIGLHQNKSLIGNTIIDVSNDLMYDLEAGEDDYEVRVLRLCEVSQKK